MELWPSQRTRGVWVWLCLVRHFNSVQLCFPKWELCVHLAFWTSLVPEGLKVPQRGKLYVILQSLQMSPESLINFWTCWASSKQTMIFSVIIHFYYMRNVTPHPGMPGKHQWQLVYCTSLILFCVQHQTSKMYLAVSPKLFQAESGTVMKSNYLARQNM